MTSLDRHIRDGDVVLSLLLLRLRSWFATSSAGA